MKRVVNKKTIPLPVLLLTVVTAFFCVIKTVNAYLTAGSGDDSEGGPMALLYAATIVIAFTGGIILKKKVFGNISKTAIFIVLWLLFFYLFTITIVGGEPYTSFAFFVVFTIAAFLMPSIVYVDGRYLLKSMMAFSIPALFKLNEIFVLPYYFSTTITMGTSYAFLTPVIVTIVYLTIYFKDESFVQKCITIFLAAANTVFAGYLMIFGSRGPVLAIFTTMLFLFIVRPNSQGRGMILIRRNFIISLVVLAVGAISFVTLLNVFQKELDSLGFSFNFIDKFLRLNDENDMSNGRNELYQMAIKDFLESPIWGKGFDLFGFNHSNTEANYPHNFILQLLTDGGLLLLFVIGIPIFKGVVKIFKTCSKDEYAVFAALMLGSVPGALFTGDLWRNITLWLFFGMVMSKSFIWKSKSY